MIISHQKKFIYIHVYKVAGTSIRRVLQQFDDHRFSDFTVFENFKFFVGKRFHLLSGWANDHINASRIKKHLGDKVFNDYFKFAFVRNPWDWQVSLYHYMLQYDKHPQHQLITKMKDFDEYIEWRIECDMTLQYDFIYDENQNKLINFVGRLENLQEDFNKVCTQLEIGPVQLPMANTSIHKPYKEYYSPRTRDMVYNAFKKDIDTFNYDF